MLATLCVQRGRHGYGVDQVLQVVQYSVIEE